MLREAEGAQQFGELLRQRYARNAARHDAGEYDHHEDGLPDRHLPPCAPQTDRHIASWRAARTALIARLDREIATEANDGAALTHEQREQPSAVGE